MGYTHYWSLKPAKLPAQAVAFIVQILLDAYDHGIIQRDYDDSRSPFILYDEIRFNGVGENGHEAFHFVPNSAQADGTATFHCCKTARKPYDRVVMQVLILLKYYLGEAITVTSDGDFAVEWAQVREEFERLYGIRTRIDGKHLERKVS